MNVAYGKSFESNTFHYTLWVVMKIARKLPLKQHTVRMQPYFINIIQFYHMYKRTKTSEPVISCLISMSQYL